MLQEIKELYAYNRWANQQILDTISPLSSEAFTRPLESSFGSVRETAVHILLAERVWLARWQGSSPTGFPDSPDMSTFPALRSRWTEVEAEQTAFVSALTEDDLTRDLHYKDLKGQPWATPLWQTLRHVVNHSTYHRGQVVTLLRQVGGKPVSTDLIKFYREQVPA